MRGLAQQLAVALLALWACAPAGAAERIISTLSTQNIEITSAFAGETLTIFGNIEPTPGSEERFVTGPFHIIIAVEGPLNDRVARLKTNRFGIWLNSDQVLFKHFPSYFHVLSSARLTDITDTTTLNVEGILPETRALRAAQTDWWNAAVFGRELVRLMTDKGFFGVHPNGVGFLSETAYRAQLTLPHDIANGPFIAHTYLFKNGELLAKRTEGFSVRKIGFERFLGTAAVQYPFFYGLVCVILALATGWLGGMVFRR